MLRNGDINLLSHLLVAVPAAYEAYRQWQGPRQPLGTETPSNDKSQPTSAAL